MEKVHNTYFIKERTKGREMKGDMGKWRDLEGEHRKLRMKRDAFYLIGLIRKAVLFINEGLKKKKKKEKPAGLFGRSLDLVMWKFVVTCLPNVSL